MFLMINEHSEILLISFYLIRSHFHVYFVAHLIF